MSINESFEYEQPEAHESFEAFEYEQPEMYEAYEYGSQETQELEAYELELAQELLEITNEAELEEFLGKLVRGVARGAKSFMKSGIGKAVGGVLRSVAKTALPMVGSALGSFVAPGLGTAIGGKLGGMAAKLLEAEERETMGEAEAEMEAARRYVRWARGTVRNAMRSPYGVSPRTAARSAAVTSARRYAPTLLRSGRRTSAPQWRSRRRGWSPAAWDPAGYQPSYQPTYPTVYPPAQTCTCGGASGGTSGGFEPFDGDPEGFQNESYESYETPAAGAGRWFRRGNRIVLVGA